MSAVSNAAEELDRLERVARNRVSLWTALVISFIGLAAFVVLFNLLPTLGDDIGQGVLILLGLAMSVAPALLWLGFFYRLDRLEPEPKQMVMGLLVLGALVTLAFHRPVLVGFFEIDSWLYSRWWTRLLGGIFVVGFFEQFLVYLTVRYGVYTHPEYDERVDGVIYSVAAGLGLATVLNFWYVVEHGGVDLDIGAIRIVVQTLAFASFAGIQGYFMGQARFETTPFYYLPLGVSLAAVVNGIFFFLLYQLPGGLTAQPWRDLILAAILAAVTMTLVFWLVGRANEETLRLARQQLAPPAPVLPPADQPENIV